MIYHMELSIGSQQFIGKGRTRQLAKNDAAAKALKTFLKEPLLQQMPPVVGTEMHMWHKFMLNRFLSGFLNGFIFDR